MKKVLQYIFLCFILLFLSLNIFCDYKILKITYKNGPLQGFFSSAAKDTFNWAKWFDGSFPEKTSAYLNEQFGVRNLYVRLHNQVEFECFKKTTAPEFVVGKDNYMYQLGYIYEYVGDWYWGDQEVVDTVANLKWLQDTLKTFGKELLVVIAPSKARLYPEYLPEYLNKGAAEKCHYNLYKREMKKAGVNFIDFNAILWQKKLNSKHLVVPQLGVHWSREQAVFAADTIFHRVSQLCGKNVPRIVMDTLVEKDTLESPDDDAVKVMNLLWYPPHKKMAYPKNVQVEGPVSPIDLLVISDSFWWDIYERRLPEKVFRHNEFWYYSKDMYGSNYLGETKVKDFDVKRHILQYDVVVIVCSESNLGHLGFGFINSARKELRRKIKPNEAELAEYKKAIRDNPDWIKSITEKAKKYNITPDSMMALDINWMFSQKGPLFSVPTVEDGIRRIKGDAPWLAIIEQQAKDKGENLDTLIRKNAEYVISEWKNKRK